MLCVARFLSAIATAFVQLHNVNVHSKRLYIWHLHHDRLQLDFRIDYIHLPSRFGRVRLTSVPASCSPNVYLIISNLRNVCFGQFFFLKSTSPSSAAACALIEPLFTNLLTKSLRMIIQQISFNKIKVRKMRDKHSKRKINLIDRNSNKVNFHLREVVTM